LTDKPLSSLKFEIKTSEVGLFLHFLFTPNRVIEWGELLKFTISIQQGGRVCSTIWLRLVISRSLQSIRVGLLLHFTDLRNDPKSALDDHQPSAGVHY